MKSSHISFAGLALGLLLAWTPASRAEDAKDSAAGTWKWNIENQNGDKIDISVKLKQDGETLTGVYKGFGGTESKVDDGKIKDGEVSFSVIREINGNKFTVKYHGKLSGDSIKGKIEFARDNNTESRDCDAKREAATAAVNVTGAWKYTFTTANGQTMEPTLKLKQDGDKVTGVFVINDNESPISDGKVTDGEVSFKVVRERDGNTRTSKFQGKVTEDTIKGKIESNYSGQDRTFDFEAKREK